MKWTRVIPLLLSLAILSSAAHTFLAHAARPHEAGQNFYAWSLMGWEDHTLLCTINIPHEGPPTAGEIEAACGLDLRVQWENTPSCPDGGSAMCTGLYLSLVSTPEPQPATATQTLTSTVEWTATVPPPKEVHWLSRPATVNELTTNMPLVLLAGHLLANGLAEAADCPGKGLMENGAANPCGLEKARYEVYLWQNRFDARILETASAAEIPPFVLKGIFMQETQFWPVMYQNNAWDFGEYGLGHLNELGADVLLAWNAPFYDDFCHTVLFGENCRKEYISLAANERALLRGSVIRLVGADCSSCPYGIDFAKAESSVKVFAETLKANHAQTQQVLRNAAGGFGAFTVSWEDTWRFTLVNYHAGSGCLYSALGAARAESEKVNWKKVSRHLEPGCEDAARYVEAISTMYVYDPPPVLNTATPLPTETLVQTPTGIDVPTDTPTASSTETPVVTATPMFTGNSPTLTPTLSPEPATPSGTVLVTESPTADKTPTATGTLLSEGTSTLEAATPTPTSTLLPPDTSTPTPEPGTATLEPTTTVTPANVNLQSPHEAGEIIVQMGSGSGSEIEALVESLSVPAVIQTDPSLPELNAVILEVDPSDLAQALTDLQARPEVASAEPNYLAQTAFIANDPGFYRQENLHLIQVPAAWDLTRSSQEVTVAVIDTGVDVSHPDLIDHLWQNTAEANGMQGVDDDHNGYVDDVWGWNMVAGNNNVNDDHGHGTHIAGIIAAVTDNGIGVAGIAPNARILTVKALDENGYGSYAQIAAAIIYATDQGARIINLGFGGGGHSQVLHDAVDYALQRGVILVAATGNTGTAIPVYPAAYSGVISVGAVDHGLTWALFSSFGSNTTLTAPGIGIYSTYPGGKYSQMSGTSMSCAEVSGIAALLAGQPQFTNSQTIRDALVHSAADLGAPGWDPFYGFGLVHAFDGLQYAGEGMPLVASSTPGPLPIPVTNGGVWAMASQSQWGTTQTCSYALSDAANSIDFAFNDALASCSGDFGSAGNWTYTGVQNTTLPTVASTAMEIRFYLTGWVDDTIDLEVNNGGSWNRIARFEMGSPPPTSLVTLTYNVSTIFTTPAEVNNAAFRLRGMGVNSGTDTITIFLDEARLIVSDVAPALPPQPTPTLPPRAPTIVPGMNDPHVAYTASSDDCAACHRSHTAAAIVLRQSSTEELVCFTCHTAGGLGTNVRPAFTLYTNTTTRFFKHDVNNTNSAHRFGESLGTVFDGANRHVECEDCHDPHEATRDAVNGATIAPMLPPEMNAASGVDPVWSGSGAPSGFNWLPAAQREYQVCLKCHSSYTTLQTYSPDGWMLTGNTTGTYIANGLNKLITTAALQVQDSRDLAQEFNPNHASFHPVVAKGRNTSILAGTFVNGWSADSMVYCTDCHTNANVANGGNGPHGSSQLHLLDGTANYWTVLPNGNMRYRPNTGEICFKCHSYSVYVDGVAGSAFEFHSYHAGAAGSFGVSCYSCHDTHGSEQQHLINFDTAVATPYAGYNSQTAWVVNGGTGTCYLACHVPGGDSVIHGSGKSYTP